MSEEKPKSLYDVEAMQQVWQELEEFLDSLWFKREFKISKEKEPLLRRALKYYTHERVEGKYYKLLQKWHKNGEIINIEAT